jgi:hypothetical protein
MMEWISVDSSEKPAEILELVLVGRASSAGVAAVTAAFYDDGKFIVDRFGVTQEFVSPTHWMPLPPPPTDKGE